MMNLNIQRFDDVTGYDAQEINKVLTSVKEAYQNFYKSFENDNRNTIERMTNLWESGTAKRFFSEDYKPTMEDLINGAGGLNNCVRSIIEAIANAGNNWSKTLENSDTFSDEFSPSTLNVETGSIQDHFAGGQKSGAKIDETKDYTTTQLETMQQHVEDCCDQLRNAVDKAAFLDNYGLQSDSLISAIETVNDSFIEAISAIGGRITERVESEMDVTETQAQNTTFEVN